MTDYQRLMAFLKEINTTFTKQEKIYPYNNRRESDTTTRVVCLGEIAHLGNNDTFVHIGTQNMQFFFDAEGKLLKTEFAERELNPWPRKNNDGEGAGDRAALPIVPPTLVGQTEKELIVE